MQVDGEAIALAEVKKMADTTRLPKRQHWSFIRLVKQADIGTVRQVRTVTRETLKRVGANRDESACPPGIPRGSNQVDVGAVVAWLRRIDPKDKVAVRQLVELDAACSQRVAG